MIVEDSPLDQELYRRNLGGFALEFASSGEDGLGRLAAGPFDLVVLDHDLPGLDGGEVLDAIREALRLDTPVIIVTGSGSEEIAADLMRRGASDYIPKDVLSSPRLASAISGALERHRLARERERAELEIRAQRDELTTALRQLREAQADLVQGEKLAGLAQLVAGVAHEINNPIAYVANNLAVLGRDVKILADLIGLYRDHLGGSIPPAVVEAEARVDLPYTLGNLDRLVRSSQAGLERVREIVAALRDFSRLDEAERQEIDPNEIVGQTLEIARSAVREKQVDLRVDLGALPRIVCSPGKLNQVVLNILLNAIQAVELGSRIDVRTRYDADRGEVRYEVADDGPGIPESIRGRIFDPFFTTKPQGIGTGLGLWISYTIVREHRGRIDLATEAGRGTTFSVILPADAPWPPKPGHPDPDPFLLSALCVLPSGRRAESKDRPSREAGEPDHRRLFHASPRGRPRLRARPPRRPRPRRRGRPS